MYFPIQTIFHEEQRFLIQFSFVERGFEEVYFLVNGDGFKIRHNGQAEFIIENLLQELDIIRQDIAREKQKEDKIRELIESTADDAIQEQLALTGLEYAITYEPKSILLQIRLANKSALQFHITHSDFGNTSSHIREIALAINEISRTQIPFSVKRAKHNTRWIKTQRSQLPTN